MINELNIPDFIPRFSKGAGDGVNKLCAMQFISYINGDTKITDYPECSARPLARIVQSINDRLAGPDGYLSPENSVIVLDLGWLTVGTANAPREVMWQWLADLLIDSEHGAIQYARNPKAESAIRHVANLYLRKVNGGNVSVEEWKSAAADAAADAAYAADAAANAADAADAAAYAAAANAANADAAYANAAAAYAANAAYAAAANAANAAAAAAANAAANAANAARIEFIRWVLLRFREIAGLDEKSISAEEINSALEKIGASK